ncbi:MAG: prenyltransferase/squalene oxidase repeat-containing protein [Actinomycetota bacterium]|nr:prenyltransferase/squalene oxidase repeat-containing protein [Actinomycetota bacterium]
MKRNLTRMKVIAGALALVVLLSGFRYGGYDDPVATAPIGPAYQWLVTQQQPDGGFEVAGFPGFETSDAIVALGESNQVGRAWNKVRARNLVLATTTNGNNPLNAMDDFVDGGISAGQAAKTILLVAKPLGINYRKFDPDNDGAVNLYALMQAGALPDGSYGVGQLNATLYAALAHRAIGRRVPPATVAYIRNAQEASGGWDFAGDSSGTEADIDTTALAVQALVASRVKVNDADVMAGLKFLAEQQTQGGAWRSFGELDPNATSIAIVAVTAAGFDPNDSCWRDVAAPALAGQPYSSPVHWLAGRDAPDGHIISPFDGFGVNTIATTQSMQALRRGFLPIAHLNQRVSLCA